MIHASISMQPRIRENAMRAMFAARKQVFIDLLGWDLPVLEDQFEVDQFDTVEARYLILLGPDGEHKASARLLPSTAPHILGDLYPHLCDGELHRRCRARVAGANPSLRVAVRSAGRAWGRKQLKDRRAFHHD